VIHRCLVPFVILLMIALSGATRSPIQALAPAVLSTGQWFEPNRGQSDPQFAFLARDSNYQMFLGHGEIAYSLKQPQAQADGQSTFVNIHMQMMGADTNAAVVGEDQLDGVSNYLNEKGSFTDIPHYGGVRYRNLYSGIDMTYYGSSDGLQYDFHVAAGSDPKQIRLHFGDIERLEIAPNGDLLIHAANNSTLTHKVPYSYQMVNGLRQEVRTRYRLLDDHTVGFETEAYDSSQALVIDPVVAYSTLIGPGLGDKIAVDAAGNIYMAGQTQGPSFPTTPGAYDRTFSAPNEAFVTKLSPDGSHLIYSTLLGGNGNDGVYGIAIDNLGNAYVSGSSASTDFPLTASAFQTAATIPMILCKLNAAGNALLYSTRFGGTGNDLSYSIAVDNNQNAYLTGYTNSANFPIRNAAQAYGGGGDGFVIRLDTKAFGAAALKYSTYIGGSGMDVGHAIVVDTTGTAYIMGETYSSDFPTTPNAFQTTLGGNWDNFVMRINTNISGPAAIVYGTFLGGTVASDPPNAPGDDSGDITIDGSGNAYITGHTYEADFPVTAGAFDTIFNGPANDYDAYVAKIDTNASGAASLVFSTLIGSSRADYSMGIALGKYGVYIVGFTEGNDFPTVDALQDHNASAPPTPFPPFDYDAFLTGLTYDGQGLISSTYWGGNNDDEAIGVAVDLSGDVYFSGRTYSADFPTTAGAFDPTFNDGATNAFVVKIHPQVRTVPLRNYFTTPTPTLTWNRVSNVAQYIVQVSRSQTFSPPLAYTITVPATQLEVTTVPLIEGSYYWRMSANDGVTWSAVGSFAIDLP
jgi:hypothetical protein